MSLLQKFFLHQPQFAESNVPVLQVSFEQLPTLPIQDVIDFTYLQSAYPGYFNVYIERDRPPHKEYLATLSFGEHAVEIAGLSMPLPKQVFDRCLITAHWDAAFKCAALQQNAHIVVQYSGASKDPIEQYLAVYHVVSQLNKAGAIAVFNEPAWTCHPASFSQDLIREDLREVCRSSPPLLFWTGFLVLDAAQGDDASLWFLSRGLHLFGLPDLALHSTFVADAQTAQEVFFDIFHYLYFENKDVQPGDYVQIDQRGIFAFEEGTELREIFGGMASILIVRPSSKAEIDQLAEHEAAT